MAERRGGTLYLKVGGEQYDPVGDFEYHPGVPKRTALLGPNGPQGFKEMWEEPPYISGQIRDRKGLSLEKLFGITDETITLEPAVGKPFVLRNAWYAGDATVHTEEGAIDVRFEGMDGREI